MSKNSTVHPCAKLHLVELDEPLFECVYQMFSIPMRRKLRLRRASVGKSNPVATRIFLARMAVTTRVYFDPRTIRELRGRMRSLPAGRESVRGRGGHQEDRWEYPHRQRRHTDSN
jgi:hypothetical protein